jgi:hypothetical protein
MLTFRPLAEADLAEFHGWLNRPHLRRFFQRTDISAQEVEDKYGPRIRGERPTFCHLALLDGRPFGYLQCYRIADHRAWAETIGERGGIGTDLAIFEPALIGKGLGRAMLGHYLRDVAFPLFPGENRCFVAHELANVPGWRNSLSVGFTPVRDMVEDGWPSRLFVLDRAEIADFRVDLGASEPTLAPGSR